MKEDREPGVSNAWINILIFHLVGYLMKTETNLISLNRSVSNHSDIFIVYFYLSNIFDPPTKKPGAKYYARKSFIIHLCVKTLGKSFGLVAKRYLVDSPIRFSLRLSYFWYLVFPHWKFTGKTRVIQSRLSVISNIHNRASVMCIFFISSWHIKNDFVCVIHVNSTRNSI